MTPLSEEHSVEDAAPQHALQTLSFTKFLQDNDVQKFVTREPKLPWALRYTYLYYALRKCAAYIGMPRLEDAIHEIIHSSDTCLPPLPAVYDACLSSSLQVRRHVCLALEFATRGQYNNDLWEIIHDNIISSSTFLKAIKKQNFARKLPAEMNVENSYTGGPLAFGLRGEGIIKQIISHLLYPDVPTFSEFGFLHSPTNGLFAASLDMCTNVTTDAAGHVRFSADSAIFEEKCRFKYLFSKQQANALSEAYSDLYEAPSEETFKRFIYSVSHPAVEYVDPQRLPSERDYLISQNPFWEFKPQKKRRLTLIYQDVEQCIKANRDSQSTLYVLSDPALTGGNIFIKDRLPVSIFINPRHTYFFQIALQASVVSEYLDCSDTTECLSVKTYLTTGFFRKRARTDPVNYLIDDKIPLTCVAEIPVLLLVTPVYIPRHILTTKLAQAGDFWATWAAERFGILPWDPVVAAVTKRSPCP